MAVGDIDPAKYTEPGAFAIQPGAARASFRTVLGEPQGEIVDADIMDTLAPGRYPFLAPANAEVCWNRAVYAVRSEVPGIFGGVDELRTSFWLRYRTDADVVWAVGLNAEPDSFRATIGAIAPTATLEQAQRVLGAPDRVSPGVTPAIVRYVWVSQELLYQVDFLNQTLETPNGIREAGEQHAIEVMAVRLAPPGYVDKLAGVRKSDRRWWELWKSP